MRHQCTVTGQDIVSNYEIHLLVLKYLNEESRCSSDNYEMRVQGKGVGKWVVWLCIQRGIRR